MSEISQILNDVMRGDRAAWKRLVTRVGPRLYRVARAVTRDGALAEDAVQEVFLRLAEGRFPRLGEGAADSYLARAVTRAAIDGLRRRRTRKRREEEHAMSRNATDRPANPVLAAELSEQVDEALAILPPETRAALWLHVVEGEGIREVARCVGLARSTAADRIRAGKDRIRRFLKERGYVLSVAVSWSGLLTDSQAAELPPRLTGALESMGGTLALSSRALVSRTALRGFGGAVLSGRNVAVTVCSGILVALCAALFLTDSPQPEAPRQDAQIAAAPVVTAEPPNVEDPTEAVLEVPPRNVQEDKPTEELIVVDGIIFDRETFAPIAGAMIAPEEGIPEPPVKGARWTVTSEADGHYRLLLPVSVEAYFVASANDFMAERRFIRGTDARWSDDSSFYNFSLLPKLEIRGWVVDADDGPLGDAILYISGTAVWTSTTYLAGSTEKRVRTGEDGSFVLPMVKYGQPRVVVYKEGYGGTVAVGTPPSVSGFTLRVPPGATVSGVVVGPDGQAASRERVLWMAKEPGNTRWQGEALTDDTGNFTIEGLPAPAVHVVFPATLTNGSFNSGPAERAAKRGSAAFVKTLVVAPGEEVADVVLDLGALQEWQREREAARSVSQDSHVATMNPPREKTRRPLHIHGKVLDTVSQPIHRARVYFRCFRASSGNYVGDTLTDEEGSFDYTFDSLPTAAAYEIFVTVSHPAWATTRESLGDVEMLDSSSPHTVTSAVSAGPYSITLRPGCNLIGRATDPSGRPVPGVQVLKVRREGEGRHRRKEMQFFGRTDEAGGFVVPRRNPKDKIRLALFHPAYAPLEIRRPAPGLSGVGTHDLGAFQLIRGGTVEGIVLGTDGSPVPYARVTVNEREFQPPAMADANGRFVLEHVVPGKRELRVLIDVDHPWKRSAAVEGDAVLDIVDGMRYSVQIRLKE